MKRWIGLWLAAVLVFTLSACGGPSEENARIERVVTRMLTCPDEELAALIRDNPVYPDGSAVPDGELLLKRQQAEEAYAEHLKTVFTAEDMTEEFQGKFCESGYASLTYPSACAMAGIAVMVESVDIETVSEENRRYGFTAEVVIAAPNGEETPHTLEGKVQLSEDGRVSWIDQTPMMAFTEVIMQTANSALQE